MGLSLTCCVVCNISTYFFRMKEVQPEMFRNKSILVKGVDGGPDENPRFYNNMVMAIKSFQVDHILILIDITILILGARSGLLD